MRSIQLSELDALAYGIYSTELTGKGWCGRRLPKSLWEHYQSTEAFSIRAACSAGIHLRFISDTARLSISLTFGRRSRDHFLSDLFINGSPFRTFGPKTYIERHDEVIVIPGKRSSKEFDLWLPCMCETWVTSFAVENGATLEPIAANEIRWLALGDSITQGMEASRPTDNYVGRCALMFGLDVTNVGIGGATMESKLASE